MKTAAIICLLTLTSAQMSFAQTRDETLKMISDTIADANETREVMQGAYPASVVSERIEDSLKKIADLRDRLESNPYVRVISFTVSIPFGLSIDLEFK